MALFNFSPVNLATQNIDIENYNILHFPHCLSMEQFPITLFSWPRVLLVLPTGKLKPCSLLAWLGGYGKSTLALQCFSIDVFIFFYYVH